MNYFNSLLGTAVRWFMSVLICSACFDKTASNRVKDSCISLINVCFRVLFADFLVFQYYFWSLGRMSIPIFLRISVVRHGFRSLVSVYLLLVEMKQILIVRFLDRLSSLCSKPDAIPRSVDILLVMSSVVCMSRYYMICHTSRILACVRSTPWYGSTLDISCIAVY
jgi:hypothetical protein